MHDADLRTGEVSVRGVRSPLIEAGPPGASEAVVFVHGNPGSAGDWRLLVRRVGAFGRALALDLPGFGRADKPEEFDYSIEGYVRHLDAALERLGVTRVHLVLHDFGGAFGLGYALAHPDRIGSVVLFNIGLMPGYRWHWIARVWRTPLLGEIAQAMTTRVGFRFLLQQSNPRALPGEFVEEMWRNYDRRTRRAVLRLYRATPGSLIHAMSEAAVERFRGRDIPVLVIWGKRDPYLPWRYAERSQDAFPRAEIHLLDDSGHWPYADDPETVARLVLPFLRRALGADTAAGSSPA